MRFENPQMFNTFWLVVLFALFLFWAYRVYKKHLSAFSEQKLLDEIAASVDLRKVRLKIVFVILAVVFAVVALARPQWGFEWQEVKREGMDIFIIVDTSKSMLTQDVRPNRLERTKLAIEDFITKLKGDRIGLIAFAGDAFYLCPLTVDYNGFLLSLNDLSTASVPRGGTNIEKAIEEALKGYQDTPSEYKAVIVLTDGDNLEGDPLAVAKQAKSKGVKVHTVGIGTKEGELIQIQADDGQTEFLKDSNGNFVKSRLNETLLQQIALSTGGLYVKATGLQFGLDLIYEKEIAGAQKREIESRMEKKYHERFQYPLAMALLFLFAETCLSNRVKEHEE